MKINTITCHDVYNYGASLQAFALQFFLDKMNHCVQIIDYKPEYTDHNYKFWYIPHYSRFYLLSQKNLLLHFIVALKCIPLNFGTWRRKRPFDQFTKNYLNLTRRYSSYEELVKYPPQADVYIAGSDQIWNGNLDNGRDPAFYLQFGDKHIKRISYAASFAISSVPDDIRKTIKGYLSGFNSISVREKTGVSILNQLGIVGVNVLDPVFLLSKNEWLSISSGTKSIKKKYLLVYNLSRGTKGFDSAVIKVAKERKLQIVSIDAYRKYAFSNISIPNAGPREFVSLIANAEFVIADSFHAMAFSLIFHKTFIIYYNYSNISRMADLLQSLGLAHCLNPGQPDVSIDWSSVDEKLYLQKKYSKDFLKNNL